MGEEQDGTTHVLGIDAGGTKTVCLLASADGTVLAEARGEGANLQAVGELGVEKVLHQVMEDAIGERPVLPAVVCLGIAGVDREDDAAVIRAVMRRISLKARVVVTNDALVALVAGAGLGPGIVVIAGTGSIAYGHDGHGHAARAGGWGYILGDEGSGYWIGRLALRAVVREADGRGRPTALTPLILRHFGVTKPQELVHEIYYRPLRPAAIAALARYVQEARDGHDDLASHLLDTAARELVASADSVARQLRLQGEAFPFVLAGGILQAVPWLRDALRERLAEVAPAATVSVLACEPAHGAVRLALEDARGGVRLPAYAQP